MTGEQPRLRGKDVLVVDDNQTNRLILTTYLAGWGMRGVATGSPHEALRWIDRGDPFDLAILDMHMPELDGLGLAAEIRDRRSAATLPLILLSSLGQREPTQTTPFAAHLTKPLKPSQLFDALGDVVAAQALPKLEPARNARVVADTPPGLRILVADDNVVNQKVALRLLTQLGYRADVAANGFEVIQALERQGYDVVLMDVLMPELDGLEATRRICARWESDRRPRIVAMTANAMRGDRELCLQAGMDDYLGKPVRLEELTSALQRCHPLPVQLG
jgi:CheY-like chemotaxis protein